VFGKKLVHDFISRSAVDEKDRRNFLKAAGVAGLGVAGAAALAGTNLPDAHAAPQDDATDQAVLNFALNLEYLEAEFYLNAVYGKSLSAGDIDGTGTLGGVTGGKQVKFSTSILKGEAREIAQDELAHVRYLRRELGAAAVARPKIDLKSSFTAAARAAGLISSTQTFDPFANEVNFLLGAFIFEDVGVTAYKGAAPLITNKTYLEAAAGILAVEAYHAGAVRANLYALGLRAETNDISAARDSLDGASNKDQGIYRFKHANLVPTSDNSIVYSRSTGQVLNIVYLTPNKATKGGFFPSGVNGGINESDDNS